MANPPSAKSLNVNERGAKVADHTVVRFRSAAISVQQSAFSG
jgi:hypothetical protein